NGERQRAYAAAHHERMVYTPQMIVNGTRALPGNRPGEVAAAIRAAAMEDAPVRLVATREGGGVRIRANGSGGPYQLHLVTIEPGRTVAILDGENAGHTLNYANVVTGWTTLGAWAADEPLDHRADAPDGPFALILQEPGPGRIVAAAMVD
ncbi:MAG: DUF1223 domain-containing protein, partial [Hasllibacter sp.]